MVSPGAAANALQIANDLNRIFLDDGNRRSFPDPTPYLISASTLRAGDTAGGITGVLAEFGGAYHVEPTAPVEFKVVNPRPARSPAVGGRLRVVAANVLNYFNGDGQIGLVLCNFKTGGTVVWILSNGSFVRELDLPTLHAPRSIVAIGDFNGDGQADLALRPLVLRLG